MNFFFCLIKNLFFILFFSLLRIMNQLINPKRKGQMPKHSRKKMKRLTMNKEHQSSKNQIFLGLRMKILQLKMKRKTKTWTTNLIKIILIRLLLLLLRANQTNKISFKIRLKHSDWCFLISSLTSIKILIVNANLFHNK